VKRSGATNGFFQIAIPVNSATVPGGGIIESDVGFFQLTGGGVDWEVERGRADKSLRMELGWCRRMAARWKTSSVRMSI